METTLMTVRSANWSADPAPGAVMLFLHGYGSNEHDLASLAPALGLDLPWASLRAPVELGNGGAAWFAITTPGNPDAGAVAAATELIWNWVEANVHPSTRIIPVGFSQGGLMASQLLRTRPQRVLAPVILGGFVVGAVQPGDNYLLEHRPAVFWGRGANDEVIAPAAITRTSHFLPEHTALTEGIYPGLGHGINTAEISDVHHFVTAALGASVVGAP